MEGLVKIGPWGGSGGDPRDIVASGVAPHRLESVVILCQEAVDAISFTYAGVDGAPRKAGPWGGSGGQKHKVRITTVLHQAMSRRITHLAVLQFKKHAMRCSSTRFMSEIEISS
jgi:hypothetical protein